MTLNIISLPSKHAFTAYVYSKLHPNYCRFDIGFIPGFMSFVSRFRGTHASDFQRISKALPSKVAGEILVILFDISTAKTVPKSMKLHLEGCLVSSTPCLSCLRCRDWLISSYRDWCDKNDVNEITKMLEKSNEGLKEAKAVNYRSFRPCLWAIMVSQNIYWRGKFL